MSWVAAVLLAALVACFGWFSGSLKAERAGHEATKQSLAQVMARADELEKAKSGLRTDIRIRDGIAIEYREWKNELDATIREADAALERDAGYASWASQPLPDAVHDAARLLEKE